MERHVKTQKVTLKVRGLARTQNFDAQHALELLRLPNSGWDISDENYIFENNEIKPIASKRNLTKP